MIWGVCLSKVLVMELLILLVLKEFYALREDGACLHISFELSVQRSNPSTSSVQLTFQKLIFNILFGCWDSIFLLLFWWRSTSYR